MGSIDLGLLDRIVVSSAVAGSSRADAVAKLASGTREAAFLQALLALQAGDLEAARKHYAELARILNVGEDWQALEPLRTLLALHSWGPGGNEEAQKQAKAYLQDKLGLVFEESDGDSSDQEWEQVAAAGGADGGVDGVSPFQTAATGGPQRHPAATPPGAPGGTAAAVVPLPSSLTPDQYLDAAFEAAARASSEAGHPPEILERLRPGELPSAIASEAMAPLKERLKALQHGRVAGPALALLPGAAHAALVKAWAQQSRKAAVAHATQAWRHLTEEQMVAVRSAFRHPIGKDPILDRPYIAEVISKRLAARAASDTATAALGGGAGPGSSASGVAATAATAAVTAAGELRKEREQLAAVLETCEELGGVADWVWLRAVHAELRLGLREHGRVDLRQLEVFLLLLARAKWGTGGGATSTPSPWQRPVSAWAGATGAGDGGGEGEEEEEEDGPPHDGEEAPSTGGGGGTIFLYPSDPPIPWPLPSRNLSERELRESALELIARAAWLDGSSGGGSGATFDQKFDPASPDPFAGLADAGALPPEEVATAIACGKLMSGLGDAGEWGKLLEAATRSGARLRGLQEEVLLEFEPHNASFYSAGDEVVLRIAAKNPGPQGVVLKIYQLSPWHIATTNRAAPGVNIDLSGVAAAEEVVLGGGTAQGRRRTPHLESRVLEWRGLAGRAGCFLFEAVGADKTVRALVNKGCVRLRERLTLAGQVLSAYDEEWRPMTNTRVWLDGRELTSAAPAGDTGATAGAATSSGMAPGEVLVPFAREHRRTALVVGGAEPGAPCLVVPHWNHLSETYELSAQIITPQEALLPRSSPQLTVRTALRLHGRPAPLALLERVSLQFVATTQDGAEVASAAEGFALDPATGEGVATAQLPERCRALRGTLTARVRLAAPGINGEPAYQEFEHTQSWDICGADQLATVWDLHLIRSGARGYALQALGRAGEPPPRPLRLWVHLTSLRWADSERLQFKLQTDTTGTVWLGPLEGIHTLHAGFGTVGQGSSSADDGAAPAFARSWRIGRSSWEDAPPPMRLALPAGEPFSLPLRPPGGSGVSGDASTSAAAASSAAGSHAGAALLRLSGNGRSVLSDASDATLSWEAAPGGATDTSSGGCGALRVAGLQRGRYLLLLPRATPSGAYSQFEIEALDRAPLPASSAAGRGDVLLRPAATGESPCAPGGGGGDCLVDAVRASPLRVASAAVSAAGGVVAELRGDAERLSRARVAVILTRFVPDSTSVDPTCRLDTGPPTPSAGHPCGGPVGQTIYSGSVKVDSSVLYTLRRRQWEAAGGRRPGSLLQRPGLLVHSRAVRTAAPSGRAVLRGGDGGRFAERMPRGGAGPPRPMAAPAYAAKKMMAPVAYGAAGDYGAFGNTLFAGDGTGMALSNTPGLAFCRGGAAVLLPAAALSIAPAPGASALDMSASLQVSAADLDRLVAKAIGGSAAAAAAAAAGPAGASSLVARHGFTAAAVIAWVPSEPWHVSVARVPVGPASDASVMGAVRDVGLLRPEVEDGAVCAQALSVAALRPGASLTIPDPLSATYNCYTSLDKATLLFSSLMASPGDIITDGRGWWDNDSVPRGPAAWREWAAVLPTWHKLSASAKREKLSELCCHELLFFLALRDALFFEATALPALRARLPGSHACIAEWLLLAGSAGRLPAGFVARGDGSSSGGDGFEGACAAFADRWMAPARYARLNALEKVLVAAARGPSALRALARDMRHRLLTVQERRQRSWLQPHRRRQFEAALACGAHQGGPTDTDAATVTGVTGGDGGSDGGADDFVMVASEKMGEGIGAPPGGDGAMPFAAMGAMMQQQMAMAAPPPPPAAAPIMLMAADADMARDEEELGARSRQAAAAASRARVAPKETKEWAEAGWWKQEGRNAPPQTIPETHFWASWADFLADAADATPDTTTPPDLFNPPFLPEDLTEAPTTIASAITGLAVLGLRAPGEQSNAASGGSPVADRGGDGSLVLTAVPGQPCLVYVKQTAALEGAAAGGVFVAQRVYEAAHPTYEVPVTGEEVEAHVDGPLVAGRPYCRDVVVTSTTGTSKRVELLLQVPPGALPLSGQPLTQVQQATLPPYSCHVTTLRFYYPRAGTFQDMTPSVTRGTQTVWRPSAPPARITVVATPSSPAALQAGGAAAPTAAVPWGAFGNWGRFARSAPAEQLLPYLESGDLSLVPPGSLSALSRRCRDVRFYGAAAKALAARGVFEHEVWKWALMHGDGPRLGELLQGSDLLTGLGIPVVTPLVTLGNTPGDPGYVPQLEYYPWVNAYVRPIATTDGGASALPAVLSENEHIRHQYTATLTAALFRGPQLDATTALQIAVHLLLQDRQDEAEALLDRFSGVLDALPPGGPLRMQLDYARCWLALSGRAALTPSAGAGRAAVEGARAMAEGYAAEEQLDVAWRKRFALVAETAAAALATADPTAAGAASAATQATADAAAPPPTEPLLALGGFDAAGHLVVRHRGISAVRLAAYTVDAELLFSGNPFTGDGGSSGDRGSGTGLGGVAFVVPAASAVVELVGAEEEGGSGSVTWADEPRVTTLTVSDALPGLQDGASLLLEVSGGGFTRTIQRFASRLQVHVTEALGIATVVVAAHAGAAAGAAARPRPVPGAYVKVFARCGPSGSPWFYKDGYTDLRGAFDYATTTYADAGAEGKPSEYSLLVSAGEDGVATARAAAPAWC